MNDIMAKDLQKLFIGRGFNPVIGTIYQQQEIWLSWYRGNVDGFHEIQKRSLEGIMIAIHKPTLQMAKKVSEDVTSLLFNEKVQLVISGDDKAQGVLDTVLLDNNYHDEMVNFIELTCVYGTGLTVEYRSNNKTKVNFLHGDRVIIIDYDNTTPTAVAVIQQFKKDKKTYHHVMYHTFADDKYRIQHEMYSIKSGSGLGRADSLDVLFTNKELNAMRHTRLEDNTQIVEYYTEYDTDTPHFQVFKLAISNNYDVRSPLGISIFANSTGTLENIDEKYYSSRMDSINSRKRIFVGDEASKSQKRVDDGQISYRKYFDPDETQFQVLKGLESSETPVVAFVPVYDSAQHDEAIQMEMNYLSSKVMLGSNYYSFKDGAVGYQNEMNVIASSSDTFRNRQKNLNRLKKAIVDMMKSIMFLEQENGNYSGVLDKLEYDVHFDDDIITDDATIIKQMRDDSLDGFIAEYKYIMKAYGLNEEDAKAMIEEGRLDLAERNSALIKPYEEDEEDEEDEDEDSDDDDE